jgi:hypothetical protein
MLGHGLGVLFTDLAGSELALHQFDQAAQHLQRAIATDEAVHGPYDPSVATDLRNYAATLLVLSRVGDATDAATRASAIEARRKENLSPPATPAKTLP